MKGISRPLGWVSYCEVKQTQFSETFNFRFFLYLGRLYYRGDLTTTLLRAISVNVVSGLPASSENENFFSGILNLLSSLCQRGNLFG